MKSGTLRNRITIQSPSSVQDASGQPIVSWIDVALVWADIQYISGISALKAGMDTSAVKVSIRIRYMAGVNAGMRVLHGGNVFSIEAVLPNMAMRSVDLVCVVKNAES